jgi:V8-like Glu-specific endopeptidase
MYPRLLSLLAALCAVSYAAPARALPLASPAAQQEATPPSWEELEAADVDFTAILALSNCSGSLVRFASSKTTDYALVLTNGHCIGSFVTAGTAIVNQASNRTFSLLGSAGASVLGTLRATELVYATMTGTDIAIYRLNTTYAQLAKKYHVAPLTVASAHPLAGAAIRVVSGFWRKIYSCTISKFVYELHEATWIFRDSIRYSEPGCETIGGTSGSPIISPDTHEILGINNTANENGESCTLDNPCEVDEHGAITEEKGASYGQELYLIYACLNASNQIDLTRAGCTLTKPK